MKVANELCHCLERLKEMNKVMQHVPPYTRLADGFYADEGELCLVNDLVEDNGYYDGFEWISNIQTYKELYPISYCPFCGKEIKYVKYKSLTKKY